MRWCRNFLGKIVSPIRLPPVPAPRCPRPPAAEGTEASVALEGRSRGWAERDYTWLGSILDRGNVFVATGMTETG